MQHSQEWATCKAEAHKITMELKIFYYLVCIMFRVNVYQRWIAKALVPRQMEIEKVEPMVRSLVIAAFTQRSHGHLAFLLPKIPEHNTVVKQGMTMTLYFLRSTYTYKIYYCFILKYLLSMEQLTRKLLIHFWQVPKGEKRQNKSLGIWFKWYLKRNRHLLMFCLLV